MMNMINLPDGKILVLNGGRKGACFVIPVDQILHLISFTRQRGLRESNLGGWAILR